MKAMDMQKGLDIFEKYSPGQVVLSFQGDEVLVTSMETIDKPGQQPLHLANISDVDVETLGNLDWFWLPVWDCWTHAT